MHFAPAPSAFLCIGLAQGITVGILQSIVLIQWQAYLRPTVYQVPRGFTIPANFGIVIFGFVFQLVFMWDAVRLRSTAQAILACVLNAGFVPLALFQRKEIEEAVKSFRGSTDVNGDSLVNLDMDIWPLIGKILLAIPWVVGAFTLFLVVSVWYLKQYFSWQSYRNVSADAKLRRIRIIHQIFAMLAKMDIYFIICFEAIYGFAVLGARGTEFIISMALLGVAIVVIGLSIMFSKSENKIGMGLSIAIYLAGSFYLVYMVVIAYTDKKRTSFYAASIKSFTAFGCMAILSIFTTTVFAIICFRNFWGGLKEHLELHEEGWNQRTSVKDFELDHNVNFQYTNVPKALDLDS
ncbi:UPF0658 Golgi apparatus membrane protein C23H3.04 [Fusarium austroafricanum]|uniref:UPF0658 Golgi apparatus membrane protein C23H3.04 n=1 Tax=Fusarium austroafricanum TaxID=2364996 RepID=A0A8H4KP77_9HYPO|nr:UPF0658 Golgi apparatus membrane protein C23H3.04 [Fusarium austroafricanum]